MPNLLRQTTSLGHYSPLIDEALQRARSEDFTRRIWAKDASLWKSGDSDQKIIRNALGWLSVPQWVTCWRLKSP
jgi:hypothetical protein